jgi:hypothetical protein
VTKTFPKTLPYRQVSCRLLKLSHVRLHSRSCHVYHSSVMKPRYYATVFTVAYGRMLTMRGPVQRSTYRQSLRARRSGYRMTVEAIISVLVQNGPGAHSASCMGTGSLSLVGGGVKLPRRGVGHSPRHLFPGLKKE